MSWGGFRISRSRLNMSGWVEVAEKECEWVKNEWKWVGVSAIG